MRLPIPIIGDSENCYQMIAMEDLWRAIVFVSRNKLEGTFNFGSHAPHKLKVLLPELLKNLGRKNRVVVLPKKSTELLLKCLDNFGLSALAPEQFLIASKNCVLHTSLIGEKAGWKPEISELEILIKSLK